VHHQLRRRAGGAGKLADREPDAQAQGACHRWELRAARAVESSAQALCIPDAAQFAEQSCEALAGLELLALARLVLLERWQKSRKPLAQAKPVAAVLRDARAPRLAKMSLVTPRAQQDSPEQSEARDVALAEVEE
jgi:hypothetical protein